MVFLISTKLPTLVLDAIADSLRRCANGPIEASLPIVTSVMTQWLNSCVRSPIVASTMRTPLWITQRRPDHRLSFEGHPGMDDRVGANLDVSSM